MEEIFKPYQFSFSANIPKFVVVIDSYYKNGILIVEVRYSNGSKKQLIDSQATIVSDALYEQAKKDLDAKLQKL